MKTLFFGGIPIDLIGIDNFTYQLRTWVQNNDKRFVTYLNVHNSVLVTENEEYLALLKDADLVYPDGWGPVIAARILAGVRGSRVNAADFIDDLLAKLNETKVKIYLLGDTQEIVEKAGMEIEKKYKNIKICGTKNGFFNNNESKSIVSDINLKRPNLVLVGMGSPKQELWINDNYKKLPNAVYWSVGGLFNYIAKSRSRAPEWMRNYGFEWLYRFFQEPKRLWRRYTLENVKFALILLREILRRRVGFK